MQVKRSVELNSHTGPIPIHATPLLVTVKELELGTATVRDNSLICNHWRRGERI
jgi:hypothetical protein